MLVNGNRLIPRPTFRAARWGHGAPVSLHRIPGAVRIPRDFGVVLSGATCRLRRGGGKTIFRGLDAPRVSLGHELKIFLQHAGALAWVVDFDGGYTFYAWYPLPARRFHSFLGAGFYPPQIARRSRPRRGTRETTISQGVLCARLRLA